MYNEFAYALGSAGSCIRDLAAYGEQRAAIVGKENVFDFSIGNPSIPAPKEIADTVRQLLEEMDSLEVHGYTAAVGSYVTRQAIARDLNSRYGCNVTPEELFLGCGAAPELTAVLGALCYPGSQVLVNAPFFPEYKYYIEGACAEFAVVPADVPNFQIRLDKLEEMLRPNTACIILNSPNNPAGTVCSRQTLEQLADLLTRKSEEYGHPIYIVSDEPYRELAYGVEVTVTGNVINGFYPVRVGTLMGYVSAEYLRFGEAAVQITPEPTAVPQYDAYRVVVASENGLNLRAAPYTGSQVVYVLPYGMVLNVLGEGENGFIHVQWAGYTGYVSREYVTPFGAQ